MGRLPLKSERSNQDFPWFSVANDLIGGWCIHTVDVPCSQLDYEHQDDHREIACFTAQADAEYIARLHNEQRARQASP